MVAIDARMSVPRIRVFFLLLLREFVSAKKKPACSWPGVKKEEMPEDLVEKIERLGMEDWRLQTLPKNLRALMDNAG